MYFLFFCNANGSALTKGTTHICSIIATFLCLQAVRYRTYLVWNSSQRLYWDCIGMNMLSDCRNSLTSIANVGVHKMLLLDVCVYFELTLASIYLCYLFSGSNAENAIPFDYF